MKANPKEVCSICRVKRKNMIELPCKSDICGACVEKILIENNSYKRFKCSNCSRAHNIKNEQVLKSVKKKLDKIKKESEKTKEIVKESKANKPQTEFDEKFSGRIKQVMDQFDQKKNAGFTTGEQEVELSKNVTSLLEDAREFVIENKKTEDERLKKLLDSVSVSSVWPEAGPQPMVPFHETEIEMRRTFMPLKYCRKNENVIKTNSIEPPPQNYEKQAFDYKNFSKSPKISFNLNITSKFELTFVRVQPIGENNLLLAYLNTLEIRDQSGNVLETRAMGDSPDEKTTEICINNRYIFVAIENHMLRQTKLKKFDYKLNFLDEDIFDSPCYALTATTNRLFFTGIYGYEVNPHTAIYAIDCDTLKLVLPLTYEGHYDSRIYHPEKYAEAPRSVAYGDRVYVCYDSYTDEKLNRVDCINALTLNYEGQLMMPEYFKYFKIEPKGNFVYYHKKTKSFSVHNLKGELLGRAKLQKGLDDYIDYCITNDGKLVLVRTTFDVEIY